MASSLNIVNLSGQYPSLNKGQFSGNPQGLIIHHTGGSGTPQGIASGWVKNGLSSQYIIGRDGTVYQMVADGGMAHHIMPSWGAPSTKWASNKTALGVELIAKNDSDVTPAQIAASSQLSAKLGQQFGFSPQTHVLGHGDVNGYGSPPGTAGTLIRQSTEGMTAVNALHNALSQADVRTANPLGGPSGLSAADYTNGVPNAASPPPIPPRSFTIPAPPSSSPPAGVTFAKVISGGGNAPLVVQGTDGKTYTVAGDQNLKYNNPTAMKYDQFAIDHGAIGSASRPGQTPLAIFPSVAAGQAAAQQRLFGDNSRYSIPAYKDMTLGQAIKSWAPGGVDGNVDPTSYINGIAKSLGITADTKLSDLTPAQQSQFIAAQQHQEGSKPQVITDGQGNVVTSAAPSSTPRGYNTVTDAQRTAMAALPVAPNSSGSPDERGSQIIPQAPSTPRGYNTVTDAQRTAMAQLPPAPTSPIVPPGYNVLTPDQRNALSYVPPTQIAPIPATRPPGLGSSPSSPPQMATTSTGKTIQVGKNYDIGGKQYIGGINAQGIGTLTKVTSPLSMAAPGTIAGGIVGKALGGALSTAGTNLQNAAGVAGQDITGGLTNVRNAVAGGAQNAVTGVGNFLSGIFGGGGNSSPPVVAPNSSGSPDERGTAPASFIPPRPTPAPWPTYTPTPQAATGNTYPSLPQTVATNSSGSPDDRNINPPAPPSIWANTTSQPIPAPWNTNFAPQSIAGPTTQSVQVANPAYRTWVESYGDAAQAAARTANPMGGPNGLSAADFAPPSIVPPAPPQTITIRRPVASPASPSQTSSPPPAQQVRLASGSMANVGQTFTANGYSYRVNADGSTTNTSTGHTYGTPTPTNNLATMGNGATSDTHGGDPGGKSAYDPRQNPGALNLANGYIQQNGQWVLDPSRDTSAAGTAARYAAQGYQQIATGDWVVTPNWVAGGHPISPTASPIPAVPASAPPPIPQLQPSAPVISPPRFNGPPSNGSPNPDMLQKIMARMANQPGGYQ